MPIAISLISGEWIDLEDELDRPDQCIPRLLKEKVDGKLDTRIQAKTLSERLQDPTMDARSYQVIMGFPAFEKIFGLKTDRVRQLLNHDPFFDFVHFVGNVPLSVINSVQNAKYLHEASVRSAHAKAGENGARMRWTKTAATHEK